MVSETRFGVLSDPHGDHENLARAVEFCDTDANLVCGDISEQMCDAETLKHFESLLRPVARGFHQRKIPRKKKGTNEGYRKASANVYKALAQDIALDIPGWDKLAAYREPFIHAMRNFVLADYSAVRDILSQSETPYFVIPGNHDVEAIARAVFRDEYIHAGKGEVNGLVLRGYGGSQDPTGKSDLHTSFEPFHYLGEEACPYFEAEMGIHANLPIFPGDPRTVKDKSHEADIFVSHIPPAGLCDFSKRGLNIGSPALRSAMGNHKLVVCGHVHDAAGVREENGTVVYNSGRLGSCKLNPTTGELRRDITRKGSFGIVTLKDDEVTVEHYIIDNGNIRLYEKKSF
jgi:Icc-related predicted phosphoesterase